MNTIQIYELADLVPILFGLTNNNLSFINVLTLVIVYYIDLLQRLFLPSEKETFFKNGVAIFWDEVTLHEHYEDYAWILRFA